MQGEAVGELDAGAPGAVLAARGATRLSLGVRSFVPSEARAAVRPQRRSEVEAAIGRVREAAIPVLNLDLIHGIEGQTAASWRQSLDAALAWRPEELYLYPLYLWINAEEGREYQDAEAAAWTRLDPPVPTGTRCAPGRVR